MSYTFTIDEDVIRRLELREKRLAKRGQVRRRLPLLRFWQGAPTARMMRWR